MTIFETPEIHRDLRGHEFYGPELRTAPPLYATEDIPKDEKVVVARFYLGTSEWFVCEVNPETGVGFGFVCLGGDTYSAELGYMSFLEMEGVSIEGRHVIMRDTHWTPKPLSEAISHLS